ncbi:IucA/IucC family protein [Rubritalea spongiae]|uniref:IucA/IucC family protein n=1 Tax=Rubritalea spongiae TaxID=430797 RepID=A0ABW5DYM4_9BACT
MVSSEYKEKPKERVIRQLLEALVYEELCDWRVVGAAKDRLHIELVLGELKLHAMARVNAYDRVFIEHGSINKTDGSIPDLLDLVHNIDAESDYLDVLAKELVLTLHFCEWNLGKVRSLPSRRGLQYRLLENLIDEGHPYHPCFKSRLGFSVEDHQLYSPEMEGRFQLDEIEVCRSIIKGDIGDEETVKIPVHPWQWQQLVHHPEVQDLLAKQRVVHLGKSSQFYSASQSLRTLIPVDDVYGAHVKLPMQLVNTSSVRTLDEVSVLAAETISTWLERIVESDVYLKSSGVQILKEYGGVMLSVEGSELLDQLGVLYRDSPHQRFSRKLSIVPANALAVYEEDGRPYIDLWIQKYGLEKWVRQWIEVAVLPQWHLLMGYAVGSEWHGQNTLLALDSGFPVAVALRDFHDGVEYVEELLPEGVAGPDFSHLGQDEVAAEAHYRVDNFESVKDLVIECLFIYNLSEVVRLLVDYYGMVEGEFWGWVKESIEAHHRKYPELDRLYSEHLESMEWIKVESLLKSKLKGKPKDGFHYHLVKNPIQIESYVCS